MLFDYYLPTRVFSGQDCLSKNARCLVLGTKALIVSTAHAAVASGAYDDVTAALKGQFIPFTFYNGVSQNPTLEECVEGARIAVEDGCDFIIGIGGGSAIDASKAIAVLAVNKDIEPMQIFSMPADTKGLPIVAIPTTAGTGTETNQACVITLTEQQVKKSLKYNCTFPTVSFVDPKYTASLSRAVTISTGLDALCHCMESYMSPKSTLESELFALRGGKMILKALRMIEADPDTISPEARELLSYGASFGGMAINATGTGFPHPLGYNLTIFYHLPHGMACAVFSKVYLEHCERDAFDRGQKMYTFMETTGDELKSMTQRLCGFDKALTEEEILKFSVLVENAANFKNCFSVVEKYEIPDLYREALKVAP